MPAPIPDERRAEVMETIFENLEKGVPLAQICREEGMPGLVTVYEWLKRNSEWSERFARARDAGEEVIAVDAMEIIDAEPAQNVTQFGSSYDSAAVTWAKNRAEVRLKLLAKWNPKKWGDKVQLGGASDLPPVQSNVTIDAAEAYKQLLVGEVKP